MNDPAKSIILLGTVLIIIGLLLLFFQKVPFLGKLPGDILVRRGNVTFYFPLTTGVVLSILISLILYLIGKFRP